MTGSADIKKLCTYINEAIANNSELVVNFEGSLDYRTHKLTDIRMKYKDVKLFAVDAGGNQDFFGKVLGDIVEQLNPQMLYQWIMTQCNDCRVAYLYCNEPHIGGDFAGLNGVISIARDLGYSISVMPKIVPNSFIMQGTIVFTRCC